jgi:diaminopimelate decarboxylase
MKTPIFIFQEQNLKENYKQLDNLCKKYFSKFKIAYSVKTNSNKEVVKTLSKLNSCFEIASLEEIKLAKRKSKFIIFNGAAKTQEELKLAIKNNFLINIDSISEINKVSNLTKGKKIQAGLRISIEDSKFGIEESKIEQALAYAKSKNISIISLHLHQGTQINFKSYEDSLIIFENILGRLLKKGISFKYLDVGGGLPDKNQLKNLSLSLNHYLEAISKHLSKFNACIILEPGRCLVSDAFYLLTKVISIKENFGKTYAILDAGINLLPKITLASYRFSKYNKDGQNKDVEELSINNMQSKEYILAGPLLFSNDILGKFQGNLQEGDILKVENVGAYCYNLAWEISYKKPRILNHKP